MMDLRTLVTISTLLYMTAAESDPATSKQEFGEASLPAVTNSTTSNCSCPTATPAAPAPHIPSPSSSAPALALLTVRWTGACEGHFNLNLHRPSNSLPVCHSNHIQSLLGNVCEHKNGCINKASFKEGSDTEKGYYITESGEKEVAHCPILRVTCTVEVITDVHGQLRAYKVVTALLCCVLLVLLLIRFTRPTVKALQKRLSDRRQNRWIGPTQSHSVSYNRGKTAVKSNDGEKRLSYPALDRLAVSDSREPSSNRNSGYNF